MDLSKYRKAVTAVIGAVAILVVQFLPQYQEAVTVAIAIATALGVYEVANEA